MKVKIYPLTGDLGEPRPDMLFAKTCVNLMKMAFVLKDGPIQRSIPRPHNFLYATKRYSAKFGVDGYAPRPARSAKRSDHLERDAADVWRA